MTAAVTVLVSDHRGEGVADYGDVLARAGYQVVLSTSLRESLDRLAASRPALVVLDALSNAAGAEIEVVERAIGPEHDVAVLVVVGAAERLPSVTGAVAQRPRDVIRRDAPAEELLLRLELLRRQVERVREMDRLRHLATHDDRTDLLRPQIFQDQMRAHFSAAQRHGLDLALLLIDLDDFGRVNKLHDHTVGDRVITRVGNIIRGTLRAEDVAGRIGGDEFAVLLPFTRNYDAAHVVRRLLDQIRDLSSEILPAGSNLVVSASIGFETCHGGDLESVEQLRLNAEDALRRAKREGGDRGVYFRSGSDAPSPA